MPKLSIRDLDLKDKVLFMRVDFNVPLSEDGLEITSDKRIRASLPSIEFALERGAALILASHLGRPKGKVNPTMSLKPAALRLAELLNRDVAMAPDCVGDAVAAMKPKPGQVLLLENLRFHAEEEKNDPEFAKQLASLCDLYVNDAFGSAHRAHASTEGITKFVSQSASGLLMQKELEYLELATKNPPRPALAILGGAKVSDKIEVIHNLGKIVDQLIIGGAMAYTFAKAKGEATGKSLVEDDKVELAAELMKEFGTKLMLPVDHVVSAEFREGAPNEVVDTIPDGTMGLDIGPKTVAAFEAVIAASKLIIWNGPMGVFEKPPFDQGTMALARAVADSSAVSIVGGGDSEKAIKASGLSGKISHISTGGGATLEYLSGIELPGVAALNEK